MNNIRQHLLDYRPATITQLFSLYQRVSISLFGSTRADTEQVTLSQTQLQLIAEELSDVYLGYLYD